MGRFAYLIASSEFAPDSGLERLIGPPNDVRILGSLLARPDRGQFEVATFVNQPSFKITRDLFADLSRLTRDDTVLIYFSGHGLLDEDCSLYFSCTDTDANNVVATAIRASTLLDRMRKSQSRERALILDCCFSGAIGTSFVGKSDLSQRGQAQLNAISNNFGTSILTSSTDVQVSKDGEISLFTKVISEAIVSGNADKDRDGFITMQELAEAAQANYLLTGHQQPQWFAFGVTGPTYVSLSGRTKLSETREILWQKLAPQLQNGSINGATFDFINECLDAPDECGRSEELALICDKFCAGKMRFGEFHEKVVLLKFRYATDPHVQSGVGNPPQEIVPIRRPRGEPLHQSAEPEQHVIAPDYTNKRPSPESSTEGAPKYENNIETTRLERIMTFAVASFVILLLIIFNIK